MCFFFFFFTVYLFDSHNSHLQHATFEAVHALVAVACGMGLPDMGMEPALHWEPRLLATWAPGSLCVLLNTMVFKGSGQVERERDSIYIKFDTGKMKLYS